MTVDVGIDLLKYRFTFLAKTRPKDHGTWWAFDVRFRPQHWVFIGLGRFTINWTLNRLAGWNLVGNDKTSEIEKTKK